jgi:hypothetical protein
LLANPIWIYSLLANGIAEPSTSTTQWNTEKKKNGRNWPQVK